MITPSQRQILEAVLEALPGWGDIEVNNWDETEGYRKAMVDVRAIINEFLAQEGEK